MRERINRLAKGIIDTDMPVIYITPDEINTTVKTGEITRQEILIISGNNLYIKGLIYSSDSRVHINNTAFGGLKNHIIYEVNSKYSDCGDEIRGFFYLVTNGGEITIPYFFSVGEGDTGEVLSTLKTPADYAAIAKEDWNSALRLFDYNDFTSAPFMQDMHIRTIYDGLKGKSNHNGLLEQFLLALGLKEKTEVTIDDTQRIYTDVKDAFTDTVTVEKKGWGFVRIEAQSDCEFIELPYKRIGNGDFNGDTSNFLFRINPGKMHRGNNYGKIELRTDTKRFSVYIEARTAREGEAKHTDYSHLLAYHELRQQYEAKTAEFNSVAADMMRELEQCRKVKYLENVSSLLMAELYIDAEKIETAVAILDKCKDSILKNRVEQIDEYCFYQYLLVRIYNKDEQRETLYRLLQKYISDNEKSVYCRLIFLKLRAENGDDIHELYAFMREAFSSGCSSPYLYIWACLLLNKAPDILGSLERFELQVLNYGAEHEMISDQLADRVGTLAVSVKNSAGILERILMHLYEVNHSVDILTGICCILIRNDRRGIDYFKWYEEAVKQHISLTRLYEYFLYSLPREYKFSLPKEILLYFSYDKELDAHSKSVLYENILNYTGNNSEMYKTYKRDMERFATEQLFNLRVNRHLAVLYKHMIYKDMIDRKIAEYLPTVLHSYKIRCRQSQMKYVIVRYEGLKDETAYQLNDSVAYVPLFSEKAVLIFQDSYGNRYAHVSYTKTKIMDQPELEEKCYELCPSHIMLGLKKCDDYIKSGITSKEDLKHAQELFAIIPMHTLYRREMLKVVIDYYEQYNTKGSEIISADDVNYITGLDKTLLGRRQRDVLCEALIDGNYITEAYEMLAEYGYENIDTDRLSKLCNKMILNQLFDQNEKLLYMTYKVFYSGKEDGVILDYLCEHFNFSSPEMFRLLMSAIAAHVETYDLEERLLAQMMFSGKNDKMDDVFDLYVKRKKTSEMLVKAFFTLKSADYFISEKATDERVFDYLESAVNSTHEIDKIPTIYLFALTRHYSELPVLTEEQKRLCGEMMGILLDEGYVFPYFKALSKYTRIPDDIMDKAIIMYSGNKDSHIELKLRVLPEEEDFHSEDMRRMFQGIYVKQKVLFEGEVLDYRIYEQQSDKMGLVKEGQVSCDLQKNRNYNSRFTCLNDMSVCLKNKNETELKNKMKEYVMKNETAKELFKLQ